MVAPGTGPPKQRRLTDEARAELRQIHEQCATILQRIVDIKGRQYLQDLLNH